MTRQHLKQNHRTAATSLEAYYNKKSDGTLTGDRGKIYKIIQDHQPISGSMIARKMQKPYHSITGRITELRDANKVEIAGHTRNKYDNKVRTYEVSR